MLGCVLGDLYGSKFEGGSSTSRDLPELTEANSFTDDTVCSMAVIDHLLHKLEIQQAFRTWVNQYPNAGYGRAFVSWARGILTEPIASWGNGALMRISPVVLLSSTLAQAQETADNITCATHAHPIARLAVRQYIELLWRALEGATREDLLKHWRRMGGQLHSVQDMHDKGSPMRLRCDETLEDVMSCLAESSSLDELLGNCIFHGGDSDTIAAVAGPIGELLWGLDEKHFNEIRENTDARVMAMLEALYATAQELSEAVSEPTASHAEREAFVLTLGNHDWDQLYDTLSQLVDTPLPNTVLTQVLFALPEGLFEEVQDEGLSDTLVRDNIATHVQAMLAQHTTLAAWLEAANKS
jgi:ADP-ribosyl-[dinitrogen reductase] hydrolase